jgi:hypothetical protein
LKNNCVYTHFFKKSKAMQSGIHLELLNPHIAGQVAGQAAI